MNYYVLSSLNGGGAEISALKLLKNNLGKIDFKLIVLTNGDGKAEDSLHNLPLIDLREKSMFQKILFLFKLIKNYKNPRIITSLPKATVLISFLRVFLKFKHIAWQHNAYLSTRVKFTYLFCSFFVDSWIADSRAVSEFIQQNKRYFGSKEIDLLNLFAINKKLNFPYTVKKNNDPLIVVTIGRLEKQKNYKFIVNLARELRNENIKFRIYGDGSLKEEIQTEIDKYSLRSKIELAGFTYAVSDVFSAADIYIQCSLHEGLCIASLEAMEAGLPVIASPVGELRYNIISGYNGYLCADIYEFANVLQKLAVDRQTIQDLGANAQKLVYERYSEFEQSNQLKKIMK